jgi:perosamine synthetase
VDVFGVTADMNAVNAVAQKHGLAVIEDSCEAAGGTYHGQPAGSLGDAGVFGFYPNKQITTGEGGMITTDRDELAARARSLRNQGRGVGQGWLAHERLGYNYRLSDISCALGCAQLARLPQMLSERARVASWYDERLQDESRLAHQVTTPGCSKSWFVYVVRMADDYPPGARDHVLAGLRDRGIQCSNYFAPIHLQPFYRERFGFGEGDFPVCEALAARTLALPFHTGLSEADVDRVVTTLQALL